MDSSTSVVKIITGVRWLARIWGLGLLLFGIMRLIVSDPNLDPDMHWTEAIPPVLIIFGAAIGSLIAWRRERLGGVLVLSSWISGIFAEKIIGGEWLPLGVIMLMGLFFATPGVLFLICWYVSRRHDLPPGQFPASDID